MQTPPPRPTRPGNGGTDDDSVLLNTEVIAQARRTPPRPYPAYPSRPYPPMPVGSVPTSTPSPARTGMAVEADGKSDDDDAPKFSLTATQVVASMSAAVIAAFLGAQLGVAGTVIGAAIASVISVVGGAVIGHSLLITRHKVVQTVQQVRTPGMPLDDQETARLTAVTRFDLERAARLRPTSDGPTDAPRPTTGTAGRPTRGWWSRPGRLRWVLVGLATSVLVFAGALGAVTVVEAVKGAPISGGTEGGFSVLGGNNRTGGDSGTNDPSTTTAPSTATVTETTTAPATSTAPTTSAGSTTAPTTSSSAPTTSSSATSSPAATTAPSPTAAAQIPTVTATG